MHYLKAGADVTFSRPIPEYAILKKQGYKIISETGRGEPFCGS
jgi:hypothetical protein